MCRLLEEYILSVLRSLIKEKSSNVAMFFRKCLSGRQINNFAFPGILFMIRNKHARMGEGERAEFMKPNKI